MICWDVMQCVYIADDVPLFMSHRDVDYNSNKPQSIVTCGDDRKVKLWDLRSMKSPVSTLEGHSHWVWQAKYNPFHDQLIVRYVWPTTCCWHYDHMGCGGVLYS